MLDMLKATHRFSHSDHTIQLHNIGVTELSHDGRLLQKLDSVFLSAVWLQCLHSNLHCAAGEPPHPLAHLAKLP